MFVLYLSFRRQHTRNRHRNMRLCRPRDNWPLFNRTGLCVVIIIDTLCLLLNLLSIFTVRLRSIHTVLLSRFCLSVCLSVCPSVKRLYCDKTKAPSEKKFNYD